VAVTVAVGVADPGGVLVGSGVGVLLGALVAVAVADGGTEVPVGLLVFVGVGLGVAVVVVPPMAVLVRISTRSTTITWPVLAAFCVPVLRSRTVCCPLPRTGEVQSSTSPALAEA